MTLGCQIERARQRLSARQREVLEMVLVDQDHSDTQVARALGEMLGDPIHPHEVTRHRDQTCLCAIEED